MKNSERPAMPVEDAVIDQLPGICITESLGVTKREYFAGKFLASMITKDTDSSTCRIGRAYALADAFLEEGES